MVTIFNESLDVGLWIVNATSNVTGSLTLSLLLIVVFLLLVGLLFRSPMVLVLLVLIPLFIVFAIYEGWGGLFYTLLTVGALVLAWQFAKIIFGWGK